MVNKIVIPGFLILILLISCDRRKAKTIPEVQIKPQKIVESDSIRAANFYERFNIQNESKNSQIFIDSLLFSFDSLQIRYWNIESLYRGRQLFIISNCNAVWTGFYYELQAEEKYISGEGTKEYLQGPEPQIIKLKKGVKPKCGWTKFVDSLIAFNIKGLPDMSEIPDMKVTWTDGGSNVIEVRSKEKFRFYKYYRPQRFVEKFEEARNLESIKSLFYRQLVN